MRQAVWLPHHHQRHSGCKCWMVCEVNGEWSSYANTLVNGNDKVVFYYNPDTAATMRHAWFAETELTETMERRPLRPVYACEQ